MIPPLSNCPNKFLKQVISEEKKLLLHKDVKMSAVPNFTEFSVKKLYVRFFNTGCIDFLPYLVEGQKLPDRALSLT